MSRHTTRRWTCARWRGATASRASKRGAGPLAGPFCWPHRPLAGRIRTLFRATALLAGGALTVTAVAAGVGASGVVGVGTARAASAPTTPTSASQFFVSGGGFGHGVGMSQFGAAGYALHGYNYRQILGHYYSHTTVGEIDTADTDITVLLHQGGASFSGARTLTGPFKESPIQLLPWAAYRLSVVGDELRVVRAGHTVGTFAAPLFVSGASVPGSRPSSCLAPAPRKPVVRKPLIRQPVTRRPVPRNAAARRAAARIERQRKAANRRAERRYAAELREQRVYMAWVKACVTTPLHSSSGGSGSSGASHGGAEATTSELMSAGPPLTLAGQGSYDGALEFRPNGKGGVMTVNSVDLEDYLRGVVAAEMPSRWPTEALEAQAVAARTYALTESVQPALFNLYDNTRSQMYEGVRAQTPATNAAIAATKGQVVEYDGRPVITYYFSSSGGYTESVQNVFYGAAPKPWLVGVPDPYDDSLHNPYYRWLDSYSLNTAAHKLSAYYKGALEGVDVTHAGVSPRVVEARVVGTQGSSTVTGVQLQRALGARSTYMSFATLNEDGEHSSVPLCPSIAPLRVHPAASAHAASAHMTQASSSREAHTSGSRDRTVTHRHSADGADRHSATRRHGHSATPQHRHSVTPQHVVLCPTRADPLQAHAAHSARSSAHRSHAHLAVRGTVYPPQQGVTVVAQQYQHRGWTSVAHAQVTASGSYVIPVSQAGVYRVLYNGFDGPNVKVP